MTEGNYATRGDSITVEDLKRYACKFYRYWSERYEWILDGTQTVEWAQKDKYRYTYKFNLKLSYIRSLENCWPSQGEVWLPIELFEHGNSSKDVDPVSVYSLSNPKLDILNKEDSARLSIFILFGYLLDSGFLIKDIKTQQVEAIYTFLRWSVKDIQSLNDEESQKLYNEVASKLNSVNERVEFRREDFQAEDKDVYDCFRDNTFFDLINEFKNNSLVGIDIKNSINDNSRLRTGIAYDQKISHNRYDRVRDFQNYLYYGGKFNIKPSDSSEIWPIIEFIPPKGTKILQVEKAGSGNKLIPSNELPLVLMASDKVIIDAKSYNFAVAESVASDNAADDSATLKDETTGVDIYFHARRGHFAIPSLCVAFTIYLFSLALCMFISNAYLKGVKVENFQNAAGAIVAIIAFIPAFGAVYLSRQIEHEVSSKILWTPRIFLTANALIVPLFVLYLIFSVFSCEQSILVKNCLSEDTNFLPFPLVVFSYCLLQSLFLAYSCFFVASSTIIANTQPHSRRMLYFNFLLIAAFLLFSTISYFSSFILYTDNQILESLFNFVTWGFPWIVFSVVVLILDRLFVPVVIRYLVTIGRTLRELCRRPKGKNQNS